MNDESLVPVFIPSLASLLARAEAEKGEALTRDEVEAVRDGAVVVLLPQAEAAKLAETRGRDIDPECVWEEWQEVRQHLPVEPRPKKQRGGRYRFVAAGTGLEELPTEPAARHEAFIEIFGRQLFSMRNTALEGVRERVEATQQERDAMGTLHSREYSAVAAQPAEAREAALALARRAVDSFLQRILLLLAHNGASVELELGRDWAIAYELVLKVMRKNDRQVVEEHVVNRDGQKSFFEYYGRWINRHKDA